MARMYPRARYGGIFSILPNPLTKIDLSELTPTEPISRPGNERSHGAENSGNSQQSPLAEAGAD